MHMGFRMMNKPFCIVYIYQRDGPDGEIDISSCLEVVEFEADKNYGLQIHVRISVARSVTMTCTLWYKVNLKVYTPFEELEDPSLQYNLLYNITLFNCLQTKYKPTPTARLRSMTGFKGNAVYKPQQFIMTQFRAVLQQCDAIQCDSVLCKEINHISFTRSDTEDLH